MNYIIEDGIDFYSELKKELNIESENKDNICLLSKQILIPFYIKLNCGHKFNYIPLYNEICRQKKGYTMYSDIIKLKKNEIKCPYCRTIHKKLIPYVNFPNVLKKKYVNSPKKACHNYFSCQYIFKSGKRKGEQCNCSVNNGDNYINNTYYCNRHIKNIIKEHKNIIKEHKNIIKCNAILKSGKRKGQHCNCSKIFGDGVCKRHWKIKHNVVII